jgi:hypothetical protein
MSIKKQASTIAKRGRPATRTDDDRKNYDLVRNRLYQTSEEYKAHRKWRYENDPEYRQKCLEGPRRRIERLTEDKAAAYASEVTARIATADSIGTFRTLGKYSKLTFSIKELSALLCRPPSIVRGWINSGRLPSPPLTASETPVYNEKQAVALARTAIKVLRLPNAHLTSSRTEAIKALHKAIR